MCVTGGRWQGKGNKFNTRGAQVYNKRVVIIVTLFGVCTTTIPLMMNQVPLCTRRRPGGGGEKMCLAAAAADEDFS